MASPPSHSSHAGAHHDAANVAQALPSSHSPDPDVRTDVPLSSATDSSAHTLQHMHAPSTPPTHNPSSTVLSPTKAVNLPSSVSRKRRRLDGDNWVHSPDRMPPSTDEDDLPRSVPSKSTTPPSGATVADSQNQSETQSKMSLDGESDVKSEVPVAGPPAELSTETSHLTDLAQSKNAEQGTVHSFDTSTTAFEEKGGTQRSSGDVVDLVSDSDSDGKSEHDTPKLPAATLVVGAPKSADLSEEKTPELTENDDSQHDESTPEFEEVSTIQLPQRKHSPIRADSPVFEPVTDDDEDVTDYRPAITILNGNDNAPSGFSSMESSQILDLTDHEPNPRNALTEVLRNFPWASSLTAQPPNLLTHLRYHVSNLTPEGFNILSEIPRWVNKFLSVASSLSTPDLLHVVAHSLDFWDAFLAAFLSVYTCCRTSLKLPSAENALKTVTLSCMFGFFEVTSFTVSVNYTQIQAGAESIKASNEWSSPFLVRMADILYRSRVHDERTETVPEYVAFHQQFSNLAPRIAASRFAPLDTLFKMAILLTQSCATTPVLFQTLSQLLWLLREIGLRMPFKSQTDTPKKQADQLWKFARDFTAELHLILAKQSVQLPIETLRHVLHYNTDLLRRAVDLNPHLLADIFNHLEFNPTDHSLFPPEYPKYAESIWIFELCRHCIIKGRMETRVLGMEIFRTHFEATVEMLNKTADSKDIAMKESLEASGDFICDWVLQKDLITYLTSVASHPNFVSRMKNLIYLFSKRDLLDEKLLSLLWTPLHQNEDKHFSAAILDLWKQTLELLKVPDLFIVLGFFQEFDTEKYTDELIQVYMQLNMLILMQSPENVLTTEEFRKIWALLTRTGQAIGVKSSMNSTHVQHLRGCNFSLLSNFLGICPPEESQKLLQTILDKSPDDLQDYAGLIPYLIIAIERGALSHADIVSSGELLTTFAFKTMTSITSSGQFIATVEVRFDGLNLLLMLFRHSVDWLLPEQVESIWNSFIVSESLTEDTRNTAWHALGQFIGNYCDTRMSLFEYFQKQLYPALPAERLTVQCLDFVGRFSSYAITNAKEQDSKDPIKIDAEELEQPLRPDLALIWSFMLRTCYDPLSKNAANLMIEKTMNGSSNEARELSIRQCRAIVRACMQIIFSIDDKPDDQTHLDTQKESQAENSVSPSSTQNVAVSRALTTMRVLLEKVVHLVPHSPLMKKSFLASIEAPGPEITIKYEVHTSKDHTPTRTIRVGDKCTFADFHSKLSASLGLGPLKMITRGTTVLQAAQEADGAKTLDELNLGKHGNILCCYDRTSANLTNHTRIEIGAQEYFDALLDALNEENPHATPILDILNLIPPPQRVLIEFVNLSSEERDELAVKSPLRNVFYFGTLQACIPNIEEIALEDPGFDTKTLEVFVNTLGKFDVDSISESECDSKATLLRCLGDGCWSLSRVIQKHGLQLRDEDSILHYLRNIRKCIGFVQFLRTWSPFAKSELARRLFSIIVSLFLHGHESCLAFKDDTESIDMLYNLLAGDLGNPMQQIMAFILDFLLKTSPAVASERHMHLTKFLWQALIAISFEREGGLMTNAPHIMSRLMRSQYPIDQLDVVDTILGYAVTAFTSNSNFQADIPPLKYEANLAAVSDLLFCSLRLSDSELDDDTKRKIIENIFAYHLFPRMREDERTPEEAERAKLFLPSFDTRTLLNNIVMQLDTDLKTHTLVVELLERSTITSYGNASMLSHGLISLEKGCSLSQVATERDRIVRSNAGYVGLRNLAMTCFMNSLLQQLFMNEKFRAFVLSWDLTEEADAPGASKPVPRELQKVFACLQHSNFRCADTTALSNAILTFDGEPLNPMVQMDVDEFYNLLFNQLEDQLGEPELKKQLKSYFGVRILQQIKARDCEHVSETPQEGSSIQCEIVNKRNLLESMDAYIQGELMDGDNKYSCSTCGKYVSAAKRSCLQELPDTLIFHLKRFEYDMMRGNRTKIPDLFEFPNEIDMTPYTLPYIQSPDQPHAPQSFILVGVLVHNGEADSGHYFSYIRKKPYHENKWLEFNDDVVRYEEFDNIKIRAFGGFPIQINNETRSQKSENAYMLFYSRIDAQTDVETTTFPMPEYLGPKIDHLNAQLYRYCALLDPAHADFVKHMLSNADEIMGNQHIPSLANQLTQIASVHFSRITLWEKHYTHAPWLMKFLNHVIVNWHIPSCTVMYERLIQDKEPDKDHLMTMICHFDDLIAKKTPVLVKGLLERFRQGNPEDYDFNPDFDGPDDAAEMPYLNGLFKIFDTIKSFYLTSWEWRHYIEFAIEIATFSDDQTECLAFINSGFIFKLLHYLCRESIEQADLATRTLQHEFEKIRVGEDLALSFNLVSTVLGRLIQTPNREYRELSIDSFDEVNARSQRSDLEKEIGLLRETSTSRFGADDYLIWLNRGILKAHRDENEMIALIRLVIDSRLWPTAEIDVINTLSNHLPSRKEMYTRCAFNLVRATFTCRISETAAARLFKFVELSYQKELAECGKEALECFEALLNLDAEKTLLEEDPGFYVLKVYKFLGPKLPAAMCHLSKELRRKGLSMYRDMIKDDVHSSLGIEEIHRFKRDCFDALLSRYTKQVQAGRPLDRTQQQPALEIFEGLMDELRYGLLDVSENIDVSSVLDRAEGVHAQMHRLCQARRLLRQEEDENEVHEIDEIIVQEQPDFDSESYDMDDAEGMSVGQFDSD